MKRKTPKKRSGRRGDPVSMAPLKTDDAVRAIFQISPDDVERIMGKPSKANSKNGKK